MTEPELFFSGTIAPTRISPTYRIALVVVAITMLLLPVIYLALIALVGVAVWWHLTADTWMLRGSGVQWRALVYLTPLVVGVVLLFFMVKPILARPSTRQDPLPLDEDSQPALFAFIREICRQVRAPLPRRVQVNCTVNASASFMRGRLSLVRNDLVLTIGLPLVAGLSIRQFGGVLAHEFGHFAQGGAMRLTAIVRGVNGWFARVVYERDEWDDNLDRWARESDWRIALVLKLARGSVWFTRRVLTALMMGGHAISCFMMRQMEFDADSYEIKVGGTEAFVHTTARLRELNVAAQLAYGDVFDGVRSGTVPADLSAFLVERGREIPDDILAGIRRRNDQEAGVFDTHPTDADRIRRAEAAAAAGVLAGGDAAATHLFRDFHGVSSAATRHHFEHDLGLSLDALTLVDTGAAMDESRRREESLNALQRFFQGRLSAYRALHLPVGDLEGLTTDELRAQLDRKRERMRSDAPQLVRDSYTEFSELEVKRQKAVLAQDLLSGGFTSVRPGDFGLAVGTSAAAAAADEQALTRQRMLVPALEAFEDAAARHLACAILLRRRSANDASEAAEIDSLVEAANALAGVMADVHEIRRLDLAATLLEQNMPASPQPDQTASRARHLQRMMVARREKVRGYLAGIACPRAFSRSAMTLAERCGMRPDGSFAEISEIDALAVGLYFEVVGRLTALALRD